MKNYPALLSCMAEYVPDSPTSVDSSGPPSPPWDPQDEDVLFPYWAWRWLVREEWAARGRVSAQEATEIHSAGEQFLLLAHRLFLNEETAGRFWIRCLESEAFTYLGAWRLRDIYRQPHH